MTVAEDRARFNAETAPHLARETGLTTRWAGAGSDRFAYFADEHRFVIVAGAQEAGDVDRAFALGLSYRGQRRLTLVLPQAHAFATLQRAPWFEAEAQPEVYLHDGVAARPCVLPSQSDTVSRIVDIKPGLTPAQELRDAATPAHLGEASPAVHELVEWATKHPLLDAGHRRGERSWHCLGQKVLSIKSTPSGLTVIAGIHYSKPGEAPKPLSVVGGQKLTAVDLTKVQHSVKKGIAARLAGPAPIHRPDEHWLQAVIRRNPGLVGVEHPALRELPAWRPGGNGDAGSWGRGYIDLLGVDGHGDIRIVETKLSDNSDDLLIFQGLDYYIWAQAHRRGLIDRLGAPELAQFEIHYVVGDTTNGVIHISRHVQAQAQALAVGLRWRFQTVHKWYGYPLAPESVQSQLLGAGQVP